MKLMMDSESSMKWPSEDSKSSYFEFKMTLDPEIMIVGTFERFFGKIK